MNFSEKYGIHSEAFDARCDGEVHFEENISMIVYSRQRTTINGSM
jgi:hypothetical protein